MSLFPHLSGGNDDNTCLLNAVLKHFVQCLTYYKYSAIVYYYYSYYYASSDDDDDGDGGKSKKLIL